MIILSGVLVVLAIALLVTGIVTGNTGHEIAGLDGLKLIYVSIAVSIVSALFLLIGVFLRRKELFGTSSAPARSSKSAAAGRSGKAVKPAKAKARVGAGDETIVTPASATATDVPAETTVYVVPGRKRYHLETCRQLAGRDKEELTFEEAHEEGFTACTACLPDTALAARAAFSDADTGSATDAGERPTETLATDQTLEQPVDEPAQVTRIDLPIARREPVIIEPEPEPVAETVETPVSPEPAADPVPSTRRSRSLFEPLEHADEAPADTSSTAETAEADESRGTPAAPQDTTPDEPTDTAAREPEDQARVLPEHGTLDTGHEEPEDTAARPDGEPEGTATVKDAEPVVARDDADHARPDTSAEAKQEGDSGSPANADDEDTPAGDADGSSAIVRILSGTKRYHRADCALIEDIAEDADDLEMVSAAEAKERGCTPCLVCQPDKESPDSY